MDRERVTGSRGRTRHRASGWGKTGPDDRVRNGTTHDLAAQAGQGSAQGHTKGQGRAGHSGTQCSKIHRGCVPTARCCVAKWDAVSMLKYDLGETLVYTGLIHEETLDYFQFGFFYH